MTIDAPVAPSDSESDTSRAIAQLVEENRKRKKARRIATLVSLPFALVGLLLVVKVLSMFAFAHFSLSAYANGDGEGAQRAASGQLPLNYFEPFKAPFNKGDGLALAGRLPEARESFEDAYALATGYDVCIVGINLSLTIEMMGDAALQGGDRAGAQKLFTEALAVTADLPDECQDSEANSSSTDQSRDVGDTIDENQQRQQEKSKDQQEQQQQDPQDDPSSEPSEKPEQEQPSQEKLDEVQKKLEQGQQDRDEREQGGGERGADKPW